jgi:hypothetical protein
MKLPVVRIKYSEDQPRDDHGRFSSSGSAAEHAKFAAAKPIGVSEWDATFAPHAAPLKQQMRRDEARWNQGDDSTPLRDAINSLRDLQDVDSRAAQNEVARNWKLLSVPLPHDTVVYRGAIMVDTQLRKIEAALSEGKSITVEANYGNNHLHTSVIKSFVEKNFTEDVRYAIAVPAGTRVISPSHLTGGWRDEREILLHRDTMFKVIGIDRGKNDSDPVSLKVLAVPKRGSRKALPVVTLKADPPKISREEYWAGGEWTVTIDGKVV